MHELQNFKVGARIESEGYYGTVRFVGNLKKEDTGKVQEDILWVGVEWDRLSRGKHDGSYRGIRYFTTQHPTGGSFLRPEKCNIGVSFMSALISRYCGPDADSKLREVSLSITPDDVAELAHTGMDDVQERQASLRRLTTVSLHGMLVHDGSTDGDIATYVENVTDLDLSLNLLTQWSEVVVIVNQMPKLQVLNVSDNRLQMPSTETSLSCNVRVLYLNRMEYDWPEVSCCAQLFAHLRELHACYNKIERIDDVHFSPFAEITLVNVEGNPIADWNALLPLGSLPQLQTLIASECGLRCIRFPDSNTPLDCFSSLVSLSISRNLITDWPSINELNRLHSLTSLRFTSNPLSRDDRAANARHLAIGKIGRLQWCNGAAVLPVERRDAELDYLQAYCGEWKSAGGTVNLEGPLDEAFVVEHPRYVELARKYGALEQPEVYEKKSSALKNNLVTVQIRSKAGNKLLTKQLPTKMTVQKLKVLVRRAFKVADMSSIHLSFTVVNSPDDTQTCSSAVQSGNCDVHPCIQMDNDLRELSFYSLENNTVIDAEW